MVSKFTEKELEKLEGEAELEIYLEMWKRWRGFSNIIPSLSPSQKKDFELGNLKCSPLIWEAFEKMSPENKGVFFRNVAGRAIWDRNEDNVRYYEFACSKLMTFMFGSREDAGPKEKQIFNLFKYYYELSLEAIGYFSDHFQRAGSFGFSSSAYDQWFSSLRLGFYSAPDKVLSGPGNLNYPDLNPRQDGEGRDYSPRLEALKEYLKVIYRLRVKSQLLDLLIRQAPQGTSPNISMGQWENFTDSIKARLNQKFGTTQGEELFKKIFGSAKPVAPTSQSDFDNIQNEILEQTAKALLRGTSYEPPPDGFHRDYAQEQREREAREAENQRKREREQAENDWSTISPEFRNNSPLVKQWTDKGFTKAQTKEWIDIGLKPSESEYAQYLKNVKNLTPEQTLNEANLDQVKQEYQQWKIKPPKQKEKDLAEPPEPEQSPKSGQSTPKRSKSPSRQAAQDGLEGKDTPPPTHTEFNSTSLNDALNSLSGALDEDKKNNSETFDGSLPPINNNMPTSQFTKEEMAKRPWLVMGFGLKQKKDYPYWTAFSPHSIPFGSGGSGDYVTLQLEMREVSRRDSFGDVFHNFFWAKNFGTEKNPVKGFARLVKDEEPNGSREQFILIAGKRADDPRADKLGWNAWPWTKNQKIKLGVPNVKQKSYRFTRWARSQDKAYDLDDEGHFIGILRKKGLMGKAYWVDRDIRWGNGPKRTVLWITNQVNYGEQYKKNKDWLGDDAHTINPNNGYSHYLLFIDRSIQDMIYFSGLDPKYSLRNPGNICKTLPELVAKLKGTLVRLGPDALELMETLTPEQKDTSKNEDPETRKKNRSEPTDQDLKDMGLTRGEFNTLNTAFADPAHIANIIKKIASGKSPEKVAAMLNRMYEHLNEKTAEAMFNQMVDHNPVFSSEEKQKLKETYKQAKTKADKKKVWETLTSHTAQREAHKKKTKPEKDKIFEDQVNQNPRYGPPGEDTQERRDRFKEYEKADQTKKETMQEQENERFTQGENASQWGNYFQSNATFEAGGGDESVGTEADNNFSGNFSFADTLAAINKLKNLGSMKPKGMEEGMKSNKPYWEVVFAHPLTYIFLFIGLIVVVMAAVTRKNK